MAFTCIEKKMGLYETRTHCMGSLLSERMLYGKVRTWRKIFVSMNGDWHRFLLVTLYNGYAIYACTQSLVGASQNYMNYKTNDWQKWKTALMERLYPRTRSGCVAANGIKTDGIIVNPKITRSQGNLVLSSDVHEFQIFYIHVNIIRLYLIYVLCPCPLY